MCVYVFVKIFSFVNIVFGFLYCIYKWHSPYSFVKLPIKKGERLFATAYIIIIIIVVVVGTMGCVGGCC